MNWLAVILTKWLGERFADVCRVSLNLGTRAAFSRYWELIKGGNCVFVCVCRSLSLFFVQREFLVLSGCLMLLVAIGIRCMLEITPVIWHEFATFRRWHPLFCVVLWRWHLPFGMGFAAFWKWPTPPLSSLISCDGVCSFLGVYNIAHFAVCRILDVHLMLIASSQGCWHVKSGGHNMVGYPY